MIFVGSSLYVRAGARSSNPQYLQTVTNCVSIWQKHKFIIKCGHDWQDEDRLKQAVNTTPDHAALNAMLARGPEEVALFQSLDAQPVGLGSGF